MQKIDHCKSAKKIRPDLWLACVSTFPSAQVEAEMLIFYVRGSVSTQISPDKAKICDIFVGQQLLIASGDSLWGKHHLNTYFD